MASHGGSYAATIQSSFVASIASHAATDPTFRGGRKKRKLKIDPRFKGALDDDRFGLAQGKVDKRGRKVDKNAQAESLAPFYELDDGLTAPERARRAELDAKMRGEDDELMLSTRVRPGEPLRVKLSGSNPDRVELGGTNPDQPLGHPRSTILPYGQMQKIASISPALRA